MTNLWKEILLGAVLALVVFLAMTGADITPLLILGGLFLLYRLLWEGRGLDRRFEVAAGPGNGEVGRSITFDDIGGQEVAKRELLEALEFIREADRSRRLGIRPLKGILLVGPPGTGKTLMARAAASYTDSVFLAASGSEFVEMYAGVGAQRVRRLFQRARKVARAAKKRNAVVFIDEIDVLGGKRGKNQSHLEYDQTLNQLLVEMDGIRSDDDVRVLVVGATNRADLLDPALLRPGRFDRVVRVDLPDREGRLHILKIHCRGKPLAPGVSLEQIARESFGFSGAHLESLVNEAAISALRAGRDEITADDFKDAVEKVMLGERLERKPRATESRRIAYHEAGHALVSEWLAPGSVSSVTVTSRGRALGYVRQAPRDDQYLFTYDELVDQIAVAVAGACSEELVFGTRSTGAAADFEHAVQLARQIVANGMSRLGVVSLESLPAELLHTVMQEIVRQQEERVRAILVEQRAALDAVAARLLADERLSGEAFRQLLRAKGARGAAGADEGRDPVYRDRAAAG